MNNRNYSLDMVKIVAMLGVICLHSTFRYIVPTTFTLADILYRTAVVAIPLFFMTSGYLMLGRENINYRYALTKIAKIIRFVGIIVVSYWGLYSIKNQTFDLVLLLQYLEGAFLQDGPLSIFWYFGAMIIIYALLPLLNRLYIERSQIFFGILIALLLVCNIAFIGTIYCGFELEVSQPLRAWNWLFYFCLGGYVKTLPPRKISLLYIVLLLVGNIVLQIVTTPFIGVEYCEYFYSSIVVMLLVSILFKYITDRTIKPSLLLKNLSLLFLPVYTIHMFVIQYIWKHIYNMAGIVSPAVDWVIVSVISIICAYVIMKIPVVNKIFRL